MKGHEVHSVIFFVRLPVLLAVGRLTGVAQVADQL